MNGSDAEKLLEQLRGVRAPDVSVWPALGWWLLLLLLALSAVIGLILLRRHRQRLWLREARTELRHLREQASRQPVARSLAGCSRLARQVLLASHPREAVAGLQGEAWLRALDETCQRPVFANGFGCLLETGPYQRDPKVSPHDLDALFDAMDELIRGAAQYKRVTAS